MLVAQLPSGHTFWTTVVGVSAHPGLVAKHAPVVLGFGFTEQLFSQ